MSLPPVTPTARERFVTVLTGQLEYRFANDPQYRLVASKFTPAALAEKLTAGMLDGSASKDGEAVKATCKALGIKHTYKAIQELLERSP